MPINAETFDPRPITLLQLGLRPYVEVWEQQKTIQQSLIKNETDETLISCQHPPVITIGKSAQPDNVLLSESALAEKGIELFRIERGGDVTFHGPGQLVLYPIINLNFRKRDVSWYMRSLEEVVIRTLARFEVGGIRIDGKTGVWVSCGSSPKKIASIGVRISRWVTLHGLALNVIKQHVGFSYINPCGFKGIEMTSIAEESPGVKVETEAVEKILINTFCDVFQYTIIKKQQ